MSMLATNNCAALYRSLSLHDGDFSIRVMHLLSGVEHDELPVNLRVVSLSSKPHYEALSYTWGLAADGRTILVNDRYRIGVTDNLFKALRALRHHLRQRTLWVDAICINQSDNSDKSQQVAKMGKIYNLAACVNIWFGEAEALPPTRFTLLFPSSFEPEYTLFRKHAIAMELALANTLPRRYERVWVVQEFLMAKTVYFCYGHNSVLYEGNLPTLSSTSDDYRQPHVTALDRYLTNHLKTLKELFDQEKSLANSTLIESKTRRLTYIIGASSSSGAIRKKHPDDIGLLDAVRALGRNKATDPRDYIYSSLAFVNNEEASLVRPDYTVPNWVVCARATFASVVVNNNLPLLELNHFRDELQVTKDLPSWAVDFIYLEDLFEIHEPRVTEYAMMAFPLTQSDIPSCTSGCNVQLDSSSRY